MRSRDSSRWATEVLTRRFKRDFQLVSTVTSSASAGSRSQWTAQATLIFILRVTMTLLWLSLLVRHQYFTDVWSEGWPIFCGTFHCHTSSILYCRAIRGMTDILWHIFLFFSFLSVRHQYFTDVWSEGWPMFCSTFHCHTSSILYWRAIRGMTDILSHFFFIVDTSSILYWGAIRGVTYVLWQTSLSYVINTLLT